MLGMSNACLSLVGYKIYQDTTCSKAGITRSPIGPYLASKMRKILQLSQTPCSSLSFISWQSRVADGIRVAVKDIWSWSICLIQSGYRRFVVWCRWR